MRRTSLRHRKVTKSTCIRERKRLFSSSTVDRQNYSLTKFPISTGSGQVQSKVKLKSKTSLECSGPNEFCRNCRTSRLWKFNIQVSYSVGTLGWGMEMDAWYVTLRNGRCKIIHWNLKNWLNFFEMQLTINNIKEIVICISVGVYLR